MVDARGGAGEREARIRALDLAVLDVRTVTLTLRSAIQDLGADSSLRGRDGISLRQAWCTRAIALLDGVESRWKATLELVGPDSEADASEIQAVIDTARRDVEQYAIRVVA
jgi:hypothetical protein